MFLVGVFCLHFKSLCDVGSDITYLLLIASQSCFHPHPTSTHRSGSICGNLKSVTSCHQDGLRSFPSPQLSHTCMCGSLKGGHISHVSRGWVAPRLPAASVMGEHLLAVIWSSGVSFSLLLLPLSFACSLVSVIPSCSAPSLHLKTLSRATCAVLMHNLSAK